MHHRCHWGQLFLLRWQCVTYHVITEKYRRWSFDIVPTCEDIQTSISSSFKIETNLIHAKMEFHKVRSLLFCIKSHNSPKPPKAYCRGLRRAYISVRGRIRASFVCLWTTGQRSEPVFGLLKSPTFHIYQRQWLADDFALLKNVQASKQPNKHKSH